MISRVADHCFWVGRYLDRAESTARLLQATRALAFDTELPALECWRPLVTVSGQYPEFQEQFGADAAGDSEVVQRYMTWAADNPVSIRSSIRAAREGSRSVREVLGSDIWEATNQVFLWFMGEQASSQYMSDRDEVFRRVRGSTQLCLGLVRSTMLHDEPMDFLWLGVLLERIGQTARILDMHHHMLAGAGSQHQILETGLWLSLLRACSGFEAFLRRYQGRVSRTSVVSFLVLEPAFPRSLRYCIHSALSVMRRIWPQHGKQVVIPAIEHLETLDQILAEHAAVGLPPSLHDLLTKVVDEVSLTCVAVQKGMSAAPTAAQEEAAQ